MFARDCSQPCRTCSVAIARRTLADADGAALLVLDDVDRQDLGCIPKVRHGELLHERLTDFGLGVIVGSGGEQEITLKHHGSRHFPSKRFRQLRFIQ